MTNYYDFIVVMIVGGLLLIFLIATIILYICLKRKHKALLIAKRNPRHPNKWKILNKEFEISKEIENVRKVIYLLLFYLAAWFIINYSVIPTCW